MLWKIINLTRILTINVNILLFEIKICYYITCERGKIWKYMKKLTKQISETNLSWY